MAAFMLLVSCLLLLHLLAAVGEEGLKKPYYLSILMTVNDAGNQILEFMQHYIEEGVDHVFIYSDRLNEPTIPVLSCIDKRYYTIYTRRHIPTTGNALDNVYHDLGVRHRTEWLLLVEADELTTSYSNVNFTIRELLQNQYEATCDAIITPRIIFSWGHQKTELRNAARYSLFYRWGYHKDYERFHHLIADPAFRNRDTGIENKFLFRTKLVVHIAHINTVSFADAVAYGAEYETGRICIPSNVTLQCVERELNHTIGIDKESFRSFTHHPNKYKGLYAIAEDEEMTKRSSPYLPWCPPVNVFNTTSIPRMTRLREDDIRQFELITFAYPIRSKEAWMNRFTGKLNNGKLIKGKFSPYLSGTMMRHANRFDVYDRFMIDIRRKSREEHHSTHQAQDAVRSCSSDFYSSIAFDTTVKPYYLSVLLLLRDEQDTILEFMEHYLEEGVDHVFIYNDYTKDETFEELESCIDPSFYSVYTRRDLPRLLDPGHDRQDQIYDEMYIELDLKHKTEWLMLVDADELMTSRWQPQYSIKEILNSTYDPKCDAISVPWLLFSWGHQKKDPRNNARYSLFYRWGLHPGFAVFDYIGNRKFRNRDQGVENKVIFRTDLVDHIMHPHHILFSDVVGHGRVCIPRDASSGRLKCARDLKITIAYSFDQFDGVIQNPQHHWGHYLNSSGSIETELPKWCPPSTVFLGATTPFWTFIGENDVKKLDLAIFHYRIRSQEDWQRKTNSDRMWADQYTGYERYANRMDVYDTFMNTTRREAKKNHTDALRAKQMISRCPQKYYDS